MNLQKREKILFSKREKNAFSKEGKNHIFKREKKSYFQKRRKIEFSRGKNCIFGRGKKSYFQKRGKIVLVFRYAVQANDSQVSSSRLLHIHPDGFPRIAAHYYTGNVSRMSLTSHNTITVPRRASFNNGMLNKVVGGSMTLNQPTNQSILGALGEAFAGVFCRKNRNSPSFRYCVLKTIFTKRQHRVQTTSPTRVVSLPCQALSGNPSSLERSLA